MARTKRPTAASFQLRFIEPMECVLVAKLPEGADWSYEMKLDGYRAQALCDGIRAQLVGRLGYASHRLYIHTIKDVIVCTSAWQEASV